MNKVLALTTIFLLLSASIVFAQGEPCQGNFDYDQDVDAQDVTVFLQHSGRNQYNNPCPPPNPAPALVPKTGQTTSYATGDDGDLGKGVTWPNPRFTDNGNGTVTDNLTNLIWLRNANCFGLRTWNQAMSDCNGLAEGEDCGGGFLLADGSGAGDWRLPNVRELFSLIDFEECNSSLPSGHPFINVQTNLQPDDYYYSSTTYKAYGGGAWVVRMFDGYVNGHYKTSSYYVWPVCGGQ